MNLEYKIMKEEDFESCAYELIEAFKEELSKYKGAKGSVQFPIGEPLPYGLISRIVEFRVHENIKRAENKKHNIRN